MSEIKIVKADRRRHVITGWANVATVNGEPVTDSQDDQITMSALTEAADRFMLEQRPAKVQHSGPQVGIVLHSLPLDSETAKALGIETDKEGLIIGMFVPDDEIFDRVERGELKAFSIGGRVGKDTDD